MSLKSFGPTGPTRKRQRKVKVDPALARLQLLYPTDPKTVPEERARIQARIDGNKTRPDSASKIAQHVIANRAYYATMDAYSAAIDANGESVDARRAEVRDTIRDAVDALSSTDSKGRSLVSRILDVYDDALKGKTAADLAKAQKALEDIARLDGVALHESERRRIQAALPGMRARLNMRQPPAHSEEHLSLSNLELRLRSMLRHQAAADARLAPRAPSGPAAVAAAYPSTDSDSGSEDSDNIESGSDTSSGSAISPPGTPRAPRFVKDTRGQTTDDRIDMMTNDQALFQTVRVNDRTGNGSAFWMRYNAVWTRDELTVSDNHGRREPLPSGYSKFSADIPLTGGIDDPVFDLLSGRPEGRNRAFQVMERPRLSQVLGLFEEIAKSDPKFLDNPDIKRLVGETDEALRKKMASPVKKKPFKGTGLSTTSADALVGKLSILRGSMAAGNDNKRLRKQLLDVLDQLYSMGLVDKREYLKLAQH